MILMVMNPFFSLWFDGRCEAAFQFYKRCLNGKITFMLTWGESLVADNVPQEWHGKVAHSTLVIGATRLQGSDSTPASYRVPRGFDIVLGPRGDRAERLFTELADGGAVRMPLQQTYWAVRFGMLTDRFGIPWVINCHELEW
jgi:PhnB protein